jgi:hypothetical protein
MKGNTNEMTLTNEKLIKIITTLGQERAAELLMKKMEDDEARKEYHKKYNARKNEVLRQVKLAHPELFKVN